MAESLPSFLCIIEKAKAPVMRNTGGFVVLCQSLCYTGTAALLASCTGCGSLHLLRALGGTRILQAAAPTAPPCFRRWRRSSPLQQK